MNPLLRIAERGIPFTALGGRVFVSVPADNLGRRALALQSSAFRDWFYAQAFAEFDSVPSAHNATFLVHKL